MEDSHSNPEGTIESCGDAIVQHAGPLLYCLSYVYVQMQHPEDGGSEVLQIVGILPKHFTESQPRRLKLGNER